MSSSGLIYAVIVGAWAAYLVPMWLRRQDELNEARPTERFSTAIRLLSGRAGMERRYAKDLRARSAEEAEHTVDPDAVTDSVDVRAFAMPPHRPQTKVHLPVERDDPPRAEGTKAAPGPERQQGGLKAGGSGRVPGAGVRKSVSAEATARAQRSKALARRRRTTVMLFLAFTLGSIVAAVGGFAFLWAPGVPALLLSAYIAYLRAQERRRFTYTMDRRRAEVAAQRLRERQRHRPALGRDTDEPEDGAEAETRPDLTALAADRRALVEQTDHAEWVDQQRERQRRPGHGDSWDPVPVPLPTYVTAPVAPRATPNVDLGTPDAWSSARSRAAEPGTGAGEPEGVLGTSMSASAPDSARAAECSSPSPSAEQNAEGGDGSDGERSDARRAASARRARERGRTPLFDQFEDGDRPRAANE